MTTAAPALLSLPRLGGWRAKSGSPIQLEGGLGAALPGRGWGPPGCSLLTAWFPEVGQSAAGKREGGGEMRKENFFFFPFFGNEGIYKQVLFSQGLFSVLLLVVVQSRWHLCAPSWSLQAAAGFYLSFRAVLVVASWDPPPL